MKTDPLSILIHSLTQSEKRQFVLENSSSRSATYMKLYTWYAKQQVPQAPDANAVKQFKITQGNLAVHKNYLSTKIHDLLVRNAAGKSTTIHVQNLIAQAEVLYKRGLNSHAAKIARRAAQLAESNELFPLVLAVYTLEDDNARSPSEVAELSKRYPRKKELLNIIRNEYDCQEFSQRIIALGSDLNYARLPEERQKLTHLANDPMMFSDHLLLSTNAFHHLMHGRLHYYTMAMDVKGLLKLSHDHFSYFENKPAAAQHYPDYFLGMAYSNLNNVIQLGSDQTIKSTIEKWKKIPTHYKTCFSEHHFAQYRLFDIELQIRLSLKEGRSEQILPILARKARQIKNDMPYFPAFEKNMRFFIALGKYLAGEHKASLRLLIDELTEISSGNRQYRFMLRAMLLQLIIHSDMKHEETVEELTRQLERFIQRENCTRFPESSFIGFFTSWINTPELKRLPLFNKTIEKITAAFEAQRDWQFGINNRFIMAWLIKNAQGISFNEALVIWNNEFQLRINSYRSA
jgi:hypothetical protein